MRQFRLEVALTEMSEDQLTQTTVHVPVVARADGVHSGQAQLIVRRRSRRWFAFRITETHNVELTSAQVLAVKEDVKNQMERLKMMLEAAQKLKTHLREGLA